MSPALNQPATDRVRVNNKFAIVINKDLASKFTFAIRTQLANFVLLLSLICSSYSVGLSAQQTEPKPALKAVQQVDHYVLHYPPYWQIDNNGISGWHYDLTKAIYAEAGITPNYVYMPYARIAALKHAEKTQVISYGSQTAEPEGLLLPLPPTQITLHSFSTQRQPPTQLADYRSSRIAVKRGFPLGEYEQILKDKAFYTVELGRVSAAIQLMLINRVDYVITLKEPFASALQPMLPLASTLYETPLSHLYGHPIAINQSFSGSAALTQQIQAAYQNLVQRGEIIHQHHQTLLRKDFQALFKE